MAKEWIELNFGHFVLEAELFDTPIAAGFAEGLPYDVALTQWGNELYGGIPKDLGENDPKAVIPPGGIAYTNRGNLVCIFFGQAPAWPVEYIGQIQDDQWQRLMGKHLKERVIIRSSS